MLKMLLLPILWPDTVVVFQWESPRPWGSLWATTLWPSGKSTQGKLPAMPGSLLLNQGKIILEMGSQKAEQPKENWKSDWVPSLKTSQLNLKNKISNNICLCSSLVLFPVVCRPFFLTPSIGLRVHAAVLRCWPQPQTGLHQSTECSAGTTSQALLTRPPCQGNANAKIIFCFQAYYYLLSKITSDGPHKKIYIIFNNGHYDFVTTCVCVTVSSR